MRYAKGRSLGGVLGFAATLLLAGCGDDDKPRPSEPLPGDGGTRPDAGPPLDCKTSLTSQDADYDGFSPDNGDCDDCNSELSPAAFEVAGNDFDEDCDGMKLSQPTACDAELEPGSHDPDDVARTLGLCAFTSQIERTWGVRDADWQRLDESKE